MKSDQKLLREVSATFIHHRDEPGLWLAVLSTFLRHVNMCTLALFLFVGFAVLDTTHGKETETWKPASLGNSKIEIIDNGYHSPSHEEATEDSRKSQQNEKIPGIKLKQTGKDK